MTQSVTPRLSSLAPALAFVMVLACGPALAQSAPDPQTQMLREYVNDFKRFDMVAVIMPIGQEPGDVVDKLGEEFIHRRDECFSGLKPRETPSRQNISFDIGAAAALRLGLGAPQLGDADLHAMGNDQVILRFEDMTVQTVSQGALQQAVNRQACPDIAQLVDKNPAALEDSTFLIGEVFWARSILRVTRDRSADAKVSVSFLGKLAQKLGLRMTAEGEGETATAVELSNTMPEPVAFRPAFIRLDPTQPGFRATEGDSKTPTIVAFNPDSADDRLALGAWIDRQLYAATKTPP